jgi:hypothetical protein
LGSYNLEESDLQQEHTLTFKSSVEPCSTAEAAAKIAEPLSSHSVVDINGISNANVGIDSVCPLFSAQDAESDSMEQDTDIKETYLSTNSNVDTHDVTNAGAGEVKNDPCDESIDYNAQQDITSEAFGDSRRDGRADPPLDVTSGPDHEAPIEQSLP